jgi:hypothetical protein
MLGLNPRIALAGIVSAASIAALAGATALASAPAAAKPSSTSASQGANTLVSQDGPCDVGEVCLYYNDDFTGSSYDMAHNEPSLFNNRFNTIALGSGQVVANNARSVWNRDTNATVRLCTSAQYGGSCATFLPNSFGNLPLALRDNVESFIWLDSSN